MDISNRKDVLLKAAYDLLTKQKRSHFVLNLLNQTAHYDDADCDGDCLREEIAQELYLEDEELNKPKA